MSAAGRGEHRSASHEGKPARAWQALAQELDACEAAGIRATFWWRDDDACRDSPALRRMLDIAREHRTPLAVAAIPADTDASLADAIADCDTATILQHGYAHRNHAPAGERSAEFGSDRPVRVRLDELACGRDKLARAFADRFLAVLVPPWNRMSMDIAEDLPSAGFRGVSCFGPRAALLPAQGITQVNTHVDLIAWRRGRLFIGRDAAIERLVAHLRARRAGDADPDEPTGLLTHHLVSTGDTWDFVSALLVRTREHRAVKWLDARCAFDAALGNL